MSVSKFNNEGYYDPVVYEALTKVEAEERAARAAAAYRPLVYICSPYPVVANAVLAAINMQLELALKQEQLIRQMRGAVKEKNLIDKYVGQINYLSQELRKINGKRETLFENFAEGILDEAEYQFAKKKYDDEAANIEKKLVAEKAKKSQLDDVLSLSNEWLSAIHQAENVTEIDSDLVKHLVSSVKVFEDNRVEVELNFGGQRNIFNGIIAEMAGEANE